MVWRRPFSGFLPELADQYVQAILKIQPEGGIILGGWSVGSVVALEMARQLKQRGREVQLLVAIDDGPLTTISNLVRYRIVAANLSRAIVQKDLRSIVDSTVKRFRASENSRHPADRFVKNISHFEDYHQTFIRWLYSAARQYRLKGQYDGAVLVFQARKQPPFSSRPVKEVWEKIAPGPGLTIVVAPGDHNTMIQPPNVEILARHLIEKIAATSPARRYSRPIDAKRAPGRPAKWRDLIMKAIRI